MKETKTTKTTKKSGLSKKIKRFFFPKHTDEKASIATDKDEYVYSKKWKNGIYGYNVLLKNINKDKNDDFLIRKMPNKKKVSGFDPKTFFLNEIKFLEKNNNCEHLVKALVADSKSKILVLEFCKEKDLSIILLDEQLQDIKITNNKIITDVLSGLNYIHKKNFIHLDLRIHNILICNNSKEKDSAIAKICNFGKIINKLELDKKPEIFYDKAVYISYLDPGLLYSIDNKNAKQQYSLLNKYNYYINDIWGLMLVSMQLLWYPNHLFFSRDYQNQLKLNKEILLLNDTWVKNIFSIMNSSILEASNKKVSQKNISIKEDSATYHLLNFCTENRFKTNTNYTALINKLKNKKCITSIKYEFL